MSTGDHWYYSGVKMLSAVVTICCLLVAFVLLVLMVYLDSMDNQQYVVNTFFTEDYSTDTYSWPVLPSSWSGLPNQPPPVGQLFNHYYECLQISQAGFNLCPNASTTAYQTCLNANYLSNLSACNIYSSAYQSAWPAPGPYGKCISSAFGFNKSQYDAFSVCLRLDVWPLYAVPQDIDSPLFLGSYNWALFAVISFFIFSAFAVYTFWPVDFEESLMIEYGKPTGSWFNRLGLAWIVTPISMMVVLIIFVFMVAFRIGGIWNQNNPYPTTISTNSVAITFAGSYLVYFLLEWLEYWEQTKGRAKQSPRVRHGEQQYASVPEEAAAMSAMRSMFYLGAANPDPAEASKRLLKHDQVLEYYTPTLMVAWADAYVADALFLLAFLGSTLQVDTDDAYNVFWGILFYRLAHCAVARLIYEAYIKNDAESQTAHDAKKQNGIFGGGKQKTEASLGFLNPPQLQNQHARGYDQMAGHVKYARNAVFSAKVQALSIHVAAVLCLLDVLTILFNPNKVYVEYTMLQMVVVFCFIIPEALRFCGHVIVAVMSWQDYTLYIAFFVQTIWCWDLMLRLIFLLLLYVDVGGNTPGSRMFLTNHVINLTTGITFLQTFP